jgi:hypothetical protein
VWQALHQIGVLALERFRSRGQGEVHFAKGGITVTSRDGN